MSMSSVRSTGSWQNPVRWRSWVDGVGIRSDPRTQRRVFDHILRSCAMLAAESFPSIAGLPLRVLDSLAKTPDAGIPVLHWFTGTAKQAEAAVETGCWFSVGTEMMRIPRSRELLVWSPPSGS